MRFDVLVLHTTVTKFHDMFMLLKNQNVITVTASLPNWSSYNDYHQFLTTAVMVIPPFFDSIETNSWSCLVIS